MTTNFEACQIEAYGIKGGNYLEWKLLMGPL